MADHLIRRLRSALGQDAVLTEPDELLVYECDGLPQHKLAPRAVVFPSSTGEVAEVIRILSAAKVPFTARGAGTGVSGGALACDRGVILELARMRRLLKLDPENSLAVVESGLVNAHLSQAAAPFNLYYAPDPSSQTTCTIGGNIAENAGGSHCLKYGVTVDHVMAVRVVLGDGEIVDLNSGSLTPGYDLVGVFVGSEGTFGVATEATLRLLPTPTAVRTILAEFTDVSKASHAVSAIIAAGLIPAALEMIDAATIRAVEASVFAAGLPPDAEAALIIEIDGLEAGLNVEAERAETICREHGARSVWRAADEAERQRIWRARKGAFGAMGRISPDVMIQDAVVPRSRLPEVLADTYRIANKYDLLVANVFHAGDGNLHPLLSFDSRDKDQVRRIKDAGREIMETCVRAGGTITGEHGVGLDKIDYLPLIFSDDDMDTMLRVRAAFDPSGLCNPGKIIPLRRGCGEKQAAAAVENGNGKLKPATSASTDMSWPLPSANSQPRVATSVRHASFDPEKAHALLIGIVGEANVRSDTQMSPLTAFPSSANEAAEVMCLAQREGWVVIPAGAGTWIDTGNSLRESGLMVSTARLADFIEYEPADLVATVGAGMRLSELNGRLAATNQWLPLDPPDDGRATVGGIAATGIAGAQGFGYGAPRHHVIGMKGVLADGRIVKAGGRVVKNVAGYDLCKLFVGSYGTLGLIVELTFKLRPRPEREATVIARSADLGQCLTAAQMVLASQLLPVAVELISPASSATSPESAGQHTLMVRFAGLDEAVSYQLEQTTRLFQGFEQFTIEAISDDASMWSDLAALPLKADSQLIWRAVVPRTEMQSMLTALTTRGNTATTSLQWQASLGEGRLRVEEELPVNAADCVASLEKLRGRAVGLGGSLVIETAPASIKEKFDSWGSVGNAASLMHRIKAQLDAERTLSPGRFVAGI